MAESQSYRLPLEFDRKPSGEIFELAKSSKIVVQSDKKRSEMNTERSDEKASEDDGFDWVQRSRDELHEKGF